MTESPGETTRPLVLIARARWHRRVGALSRALELLDEAGALLERAGGSHDATVSYLLEERGATRFARGEFDLAAFDLARALELRRAAPTARAKLLPCLKRLAAARIALRSDRLESPWGEALPPTENPAPPGSQAPAPPAPPGEDFAEAIALRSLLLEIAELSAPDPRDPNRDMDRAWALAQAAELRLPGWERERREAVEAVGLAFLDEADTEAVSDTGETSLRARRWRAKRRADHLGSWSLHFASWVQTLYENAYVEQTAGGTAEPSVALAEAARDRAQSLLRGGELRESGALLRQVADWSASLLGPEHLESVLAGAELAARDWRATGGLPEVESAFARLVEQLETDLAVETVALGQALADLAAVRAEMGQFEEARAAAGRAAAILDRQLGPRSPILAGTAPVVAWALRESGRPDEAEALLRKAPADKSLSICSQLHLNRGLLLSSLRLRAGDLDSARESMRAEIGRCSRSGAIGTNLEPLTEILASGYSPCERPRDAEGLDDFFHRGEKRAAATAFLGKTLLITLPFAAAVLASGAEIRYDSEQGASDGLRWLAEPLGLTGKVMGWTAEQLRDPAFALVPAVDPNREAEFYGVAGELLRGLGYYREAIALGRGAIAGMETGAGQGHPRLAAIYSELARAYWDASSGGSKAEREEDEAGALAAATRSAEILGSFLHQAVPALPEQLALRLVSSRAHPEETLFSGLLHARGPKAGWRNAAWEWSLRNRSLVLDALAQRHRAVVDIDSTDVAQRNTELATARQRLAALWVRGPEAGYPHWLELDQARRARDQAEAALAAVSRDHARADGARQISAATVARALPERSALVQYVRVPVRHPAERTAGARYVALVLDPQAQSKAVDLGSAEQVDALVEAWLAALRESYGQISTPGASGALSPDPDGRSLRSRVWDPVAAALGSVDLVFVVFDGALHQIHLGALPLEDRGFVAESGPAIHLLSTGRELLKTAVHETALGEGLLALGDPDFDRAVAEPFLPASAVAPFRGSPPTCSSLRAVRWQSLPESRREVEEIASLFRQQGSAELLLGTDASEERLKRAAAGRRYLHVATHGYFLPDDCAAPAAGGRGIGGIVETAGSGRPTSDAAVPPASPVAASNPLLLSGLVLAGANRADSAEPRAEDGIVTAEELAALDLGGVRIAALSACDTGRGTVANGEGVFGLRRALEIAGARTVLMSLWSVPDDVARRWMTAFYERVFAGEPVARAARSADLASLHEARAGGLPDHPYLWAGFVAAGDWR